MPANKSETAEQAQGPTATIYVVRHAKAADRAGWTGDDIYRPLTRGGQRQALALSERLSAAIDSTRVAVASSPATRCRETLDPLAAHLGVATVTLAQLAEGSSPVDALAAATGLCSPGPAGRPAGGPAGSPAGGQAGATAGEKGHPLTRHVVVCTHGDVMWGMLDELEPEGFSLPPPVSVPKACTLEIDLAGGVVVALRYVPPSSSHRDSREVS